MVRRKKLARAKMSLVELAQRAVGEGAGARSRCRWGNTLGPA
jgi:hypothetical protein